MTRLSLVMVAVLLLSLFGVASAQDRVTGDSLDWFNGLRMKCVEGLESGRAKIVALTGADVSHYKK